MATQSSILVWESHRQRSLTGYSPWGHERVGHDLVTKAEIDVFLELSCFFYNLGAFIKVSKCESMN